jgi:hypothetical protein
VRGTKGELGLTVSTDSGKHELVNDDLFLEMEVHIGAASIERRKERRHTQTEQQAKVSKRLIEREGGHKRRTGSWR